MAPRMATNQHVFLVAIATEQASSAVGTVESYSKMLRSLEDLLAKIDKSNVKEREMARKVMEEMDTYREKLFDAARKGIIKVRVMQQGRGKRLTWAAR